MIITEDMPRVKHGDGLAYVLASEKHKKYFDMIRVGVPYNGVQDMMRRCGVDPALLDHPEQMVPAKDLPKAEKQAKLKYERAVAMPSPVTFGAAEFEGATGVVEVIRGKAWMVPNLLTPEECQEIVGLGEEAGMVKASEYVTRVSKRTKDYVNQELANSVFSKLPSELHSVVDVEPPYCGWGIHGVHPNWRISKYEREHSFPAHYDGADVQHYTDSEGRRRRAESTHTVLIGLCEKSTYSGGETRFFLSKDYDPGSMIDVELPIGGALVFLQKGLLHAGQPISDGVKYIAQAGLLRELPLEGRLPVPSIFKNGPGLSLY